MLVGGLPDLWLPWAGLPLIALLLPLVLIDLDHLWLPEPLCRWGVVLGLLVSTAAGIPVLASHLIAAVLALLLLEGLSALAERLLGQPALGLGDAKLAA
ncbi:MAG: prepilin peptidase, partial [Cyanobacteriota bacterium]|nr:prepilin peptidase [Cyanobacteriota bacterium]